jgi:hypothetical protein
MKFLLKGKEERRYLGIHEYTFPSDVTRSDDPEETNHKSG